MGSNRNFRSWTAAWIFGAVFIGVGLLLALSLIFGRFPSSGYYPPFFFGWWFFIPLFFFGFFFLFRWWGWGSRWYYYDPALETLRQRLARGEITKDQYEQLRKDLESS